MTVFRCYRVLFLTRSWHFETPIEHILLWPTESDGCVHSLLRPFRFVSVSVCGRSWLWPFRCGFSCLWPVSVCGRVGFVRPSCWPLSPDTTAAISLANFNGNVPCSRPKKLKLLGVQSYGKNSLFGVRCFSQWLKYGNCDTAYHSKTKKIIILISNNYLYMLS